MRKFAFAATAAGQWVACAAFGGDGLVAGAATIGAAVALLIHWIMS